MAWKTEMFDALLKYVKAEHDPQAWVVVGLNEFYAGGLGDSVAITYLVKGVAEVEPCYYYGPLTSLFDELPD